MNSPGFSLSVQVVKAFGEFLNIGLLPLNVRAMFLHFVGHIAAAGLGISQILLSVCNNRSFAPQLRCNVLETRIHQRWVHSESWKKKIKRKKWHGLWSLPPIHAGSSPVRWGRMVQSPLLPVCFHSWTVELCHSAENSPADRSSAIYKSAILSSKFKFSFSMTFLNSVVRKKKSILTCHLHTSTANRLCCIFY